jgi:hypothetical protein
VGSERFEAEKRLEDGMARVRGTRFVFVVTVTAMLTLAAGAASGQDEGVLPPNLDENTTPEEGRGEKLEVSEAQEPPKEEEASGQKALGEAPTLERMTREDAEKSGASPKEPSSPPTPSLASEGVLVSGSLTSGYEAPDGTSVPVGAVSSGGLARLPATGGAY